MLFHRLSCVCFWGSFDSLFISQYLHWDFTISAHQSSISRDNHVVFVEVLDSFELSASMMNMNLKQAPFRSMFDLPLPLMYQCQGRNNQSRLSC